MSEIENDGWITVHPKLPQISDKVSDQLHRAFDDITKATTWTNGWGTACGSQ
jgi:hypothetical protein